MPPEDPTLQLIAVSCWHLQKALEIMDNGDIIFLEDESKVRGLQVVFQILHFNENFTSKVHPPYFSGFLLTWCRLWICTSPNISNVGSTWQMRA